MARNDNHAPSVMGRKRQWYFALGLILLWLAVFLAIKFHIIP